MKKKKATQSRNKVTDEIDLLAEAMARAVSGIEVRVSDIEDEHAILKNQILNLSNRVSYLEKKVLKKLREHE